VDVVIGRVLGETSLRSATGNGIRLWDVAAAAYRPTPFVGHADRINALAVSLADGSQARVGEHGQSVILWDVKTARSVVGQMGLSRILGCHRRP